MNKICRSCYGIFSIPELIYDVTESERFSMELCQICYAKKKEEFMNTTPPPKPETLTPEENWCEICHREKISTESSVCACLGIQPYAMSVYPGEYKLVSTHPSNGGEQWYKRSDVELALRQSEERMNELDKRNKDLLIKLSRLNTANAEIGHGMLCNIVKEAKTILGMCSKGVICPTCHGEGRYPFCGTCKNALYLLPTPNGGMKE